MNKLTVIGPKSVHVLNFINTISAHANEIGFIGNGGIESQYVSTQHVVNFNSVNPFKLISNYYKLKKILKQNQPNLVHIHQVNRQAFFASMACKKLKIPVVITAWGSDVLKIPNESALKKSIVKRTLNNSGSITADSNEMIEAIKKIAPSKEVIELVILGIDPIEAGVKEKIVYSNRLHTPLYNIDHIITDFADFHKTNPSWRLLIAGEGEKTQAYKDLVIKLGIQSDVEFLGWLENSENRANYKKASVFMSLPESDGTAVSLMEAMSAGCIPIVSDLVVSKQWITDGRNGIIKKRGEKNIIKRALELNHENVAEINKEIIEKNATREVAAKQFLKLYVNLLAK